MLHRSLITFLALACCAGAPLQRAHAAIDGAFIQSTPSDTGREELPYDSEYAAAAREFGFGNGTPEADARPGQYYFLEAVHAFRKKEYAFAIQMYQVAASWAYKPAEYNLGVIYARGQGVPVDLPRAMAWMALAAERNEDRYVQAREAVYAALTKEQFDEANSIWRDLKKTYGDGVALRRAKAHWAEVRSHMTGSRVGFVGNLSVGMPNPGSGVSQDSRLATRLAEMNSGKSAAGAHSAGLNAGPTTAGEVLGGGGVDGSIAYRQLRESDNPYDPKFDKSALGKATVGPIEEVKAGKAKPAAKDAAEAKDDQ